MNTIEIFEKKFSKKTKCTAAADVALVVLKNYSLSSLNPTEIAWAAELDASLLRENGIECSVSGDVAITINPGYGIGNPVKLMVREDVAEEAAALLKFPREKNPDPELPTSMLARYISKYGKIAGIALFVATMILLAALFIITA